MFDMTKKSTDDFPIDLASALVVVPPTIAAIFWSSPVAMIAIAFGFVAGMVRADRARAIDEDLRRALGMADEAVTSFHDLKDRVEQIQNRLSDPQQDQIRSLVEMALETADEDWVRHLRASIRCVASSRTEDAQRHFAVVAMRLLDPNAAAGLVAVADLVTARAKREALESIEAGLRRVLDGEAFAANRINWSDKGAQWADLHVEELGVEACMAMVETHVEGLGTVELLQNHHPSFTSEDLTDDVFAVYEDSLHGRSMFIRFLVASGLASQGGSMYGMNKHIRLTAMGLAAYGLLTS